MKHCNMNVIIISKKQSNNTNQDIIKFPFIILATDKTAENSVITYIKM